MSRCPDKHLVLTTQDELMFFFFFSSRRRHTRLQGDWSSDVCSSDLEDPAGRPEEGKGLARSEQVIERAEYGVQHQRGPEQDPHSPPVALDQPLLPARSEEHTSELQSPCNLVCRLLLEKKKKNVHSPHYSDVLCHDIEQSHAHL